MTLITAHRILISTFAAFSLLLCGLQIKRYGTTGAMSDLAFGIGSGVVAVGCVIYLLRARHLSRGP